jgi:hypothetical protein
VAPTTERRHHPRHQLRRTRERRSQRCPVINTLSNPSALLAVVYFVIYIY